MLTSSTRGRAVPAVLLTVVAAFSLAACQDDQDKASGSLACGVLTKDTVRAIAGTSQVSVLGDLTAPADGSGARCEINADAGAAQYAILSVNDRAASESDQHFTELVTRERASVKDCTSIDDLEPAGYLCHRADGAEAAVATKDRLVRVSILSDGAFADASSADVTAWVDEILGQE